MSALSFRSLAFMLLIACLVWSSHLQTCSARRGKHWRQTRGAPASLYKKKGKNDHQSNADKTKHEAPPPPSSAPPPPSLSPKAAPPPPSPMAPPPPPLSPKAPSPPPPLSPNAPPPPPLSPNEPPPPPPLLPKAPPPPLFPKEPPPPPSPNAPPPPPLSSKASPPPLSPNAPSPPQSPKAPPPSLNALPPPPSSPKAPPPPPPAPKAPQHPQSPKAPAPPPLSPKAPPPLAPKLPSTIFNVLDFGAKGDGTSDDTKAFLAAWTAACKVEASRVMVPLEFTFLVGPISFSGLYCQPSIVFQLDGTIIAPTSSRAWGSGLLQWLEFTKLRGITFQGSGTIDGRGSVWWQESPYDDPADDESKLIIPLNNTVVENPPIPISSSPGGQMPSIRPTALRFYGSSNVMVMGITIQNSPNCHLKFDSCIGVLVSNMNISSPGNSPNTDGIHLQNSHDVLIRSTNLACGDDCVSIQTGCTNVYIHNVNCGPGHGISIGGLGKDTTRACVSNITVRDISMHNTMTGVRIKTWQGGSGSVQALLFSNIQVSEVQIPIVIDQYYCDRSKCKNQTSAVALSDITYEKIRGTYTIQPVYLACSDSIPCVDVTLTDIELNPLQEQYHMYDAFCWQTFGKLKSPIEPPINCLQDGKQSSHRIQTDYDSCQA